ncbi:CHAT domain-containing protein [Kitasatospora purpeofusca]|uniref:CHAT domain-containing protein n=1 Tax=Kitasatospora purpeofusca TaxID=67352 RepID=UPI0004C09CED|nr:CHAT domain-containing protein [Kitasatospora purpeofusca]
MITGLVVETGGFELVVGGEGIGPRRLLQDSDVAWLTAVAGRYVDAVRGGSRREVLLALGRELYGWLDGDRRRLTRLLDEAPVPVLFEVRGPRRPSAAEWALLRAPFELLAAPGGGFLVEEPEQFAVVRRLGRPGPADALDDRRLGVAFMASSPRGQNELDYEAEELAILGAVGETGLDLVVEDSGNPERLGVRLSELGGMPVVHLSCHGLHNWRERPGDRPTPVLLLEDDLGQGRPTSAKELVGLLTPRPRLAFVSACLTATGADVGGHLPAGAGRRGAPGTGAGAAVAHSLATELVAAGIPAVIGWDGSVSDRAATLFAEHLYARLGLRVTVAEAVAAARRELLESPDEHVRADWHLARLWLGPAGGGPLVAGTVKRRMAPAHHATTTFLGSKHDVPVAAAGMFVGRRPELQQALRALRGRRHGGVLLHGQGRLGKSSLAARIADRLPDRAVAVVFGDYTRAAVLDAVATAVEPFPDARDLLRDRRADVREHPDRFRALLVDLLAGPCAQAQGTRRPLLLVVDDLEQILTAHPDGPHRVDNAHNEVLADVISAFDPATTDSRLLLTSRYTFTLDGLERRLEPVQLQPLSPAARHKLRRRQQDLATTENRLPDTEPARRTDLARRAMEVSRGNPGLQDLIVLRLVYGEHVDPARAEAAIAAMENYLRQGDPADDPDLAAFLENLALDTLLQQAGPAHQDLLRACTLFTLPVPQPVVDTLAEAVGGSASRLRGLGLLDAYPDDYHRPTTAVAVNALAAGHLTPLSPDERTTLAALAVEPLHTRWGGPSPRPRRSTDLDLQLTRLALDADNPAVTADCAAKAVSALRRGPASAAAALGQRAIALLDRHHHPVPLPLLRAVADAAVTSGDGERADTLLHRAVQQIQTDPQHTDPANHAAVLHDHANRLLTRGETGQAETLLHQARQLFTDLGDTRSAAITWGQIADILQQRGEVEEALRIRREVELPEYQRIGDTRSTAITWGQIADILQQRGEVEEALRIRHEVQLPEYQRIGDTRSAAITWGKIADILQQRGEADEALRIRREVELPEYQRIGDTRSAAIAWGQIADILQQRGDVDEALRIRHEVELPAFERIGDTRSAAIAWGKIADILQQRGEVDEALRIRHEVQLPAFERIGDTRFTAATWGQIADVLQQRGEMEEALRIRREVQLPEYQRIGDTRSTAIAWGQIADILQQRGEVDEALRIRHEIELPAFEGVGDTRSTAITWGKIGDVLQQRGDVDEALRIRHEVQLPAFERVSDTREAAVTWGQIADILQQRGEVDEALRIRHEIELPAFERIGDTRSTAITWGKIAHILQQRGQAGEAVELQLKRLEVNERLGDIDGIAAANWDLARIDLDGGDLHAAVPRLVTSFQHFLELQRPDGIAVVGITLGQVMLASGARAQARQVLQACRAAAAVIGAADIVFQAEQLMETISDEDEES